MNLNWRSRWDVVFLLDVLEHLPFDVEALAQVRNSMRPGGILFITVPALKIFWSWNDELSGHLRRYSRSQLESIAIQAGFEPLVTRYFMFFLSPLLFLSRLNRPSRNKNELLAASEKAHRIPAEPLNLILSEIFKAETPLGMALPFPWGTSVLGVFRAPLLD